MKKIILVIEDEQALLNMVTLKLEINNFQVIPMQSVTEVFSFDLKKIAAIWLDHNLLGDENGLDFVRKLKHLGGSFSHMPIFVVSNTSNPYIVKSYAELGVTKYYFKAEYKLEKIVEEIKNIFE